MGQLLSQFDKTVNEGQERGRRWLAAPRPGTGARLGAGRLQALAGQLALGARPQKA